MHHYLVTTFNNERFLVEMLDSIRRQYPSAESFEREAQVLIVDDCSTDASRGVLVEMQYAYRNVNVHFNERNQGIGRNRNDLLDWLYSAPAGYPPVRETDFVLFVDGDDVLAATYMADKLALFAQRFDLDVVGGQLELFYEDGTPRHIVDTFSTDPDILEIANMFECHVYVSNALFRARVFRSPMVRFPETPTSEDWLFFAQHRLKVEHVPNVTLHYRRHAANVTLSAPSGPVAELRHLAHRLSALKMGMHLSTRDCQLLDMVGYLSFRARWTGSEMVPADVHMPWFAFLSVRTDYAKPWPAYRAELSALFARMRDHNSRLPGFNAHKLELFLSNIHQLAEEEVDIDEPVVC